MKNVKIICKQDDSFDMERLEINDVCIAEGNSWDCHMGYQVKGIMNTLKLLGIPFTIEYNNDWRYR